MIENREKRNAPYLWRQVLTTLGSGVLSICAGATFGVTAVLLPQLREDKSFDYDGSEDSWIASVASLTMIIGALGAGSILDAYGRRLAHIIISIPFIIGWTCITFAKSTTLIVIGRLITGISSGAHRPVVLVYIGEIADPKYRTLALFFPGLLQHIGVLFSHLVGSYYSWRLSAIIWIIPSVLSSMGFLFLKESPLWLISKGRIEEGANYFRWFRGTGEVAEAELKAVLQSQANIGKPHVRDIIDFVCSLSFIKPFLIIQLIMVNIQFSGVNVFNFYAYDIFEKTFSGSMNPFIMMIVSDCVRGFVSIIVCLFAQKLRTKTVFLVCDFGLAVFLYVLVAYLILVRVGHVWIPITCLVLYTGLSGALITTGYTCVPELMPSKVRGFGSGLTSATSFLFLFIVVRICPDIMNNFGESTMFAGFATSSLICGLLFSFLLPDTHGKTLQSIEDSFNKDYKISEQTKL